MAAEQIGTRATARLFGCSRNTVRKWLRRRREEGKAGLQECSRTPRRILHKTPPELKRAVLAGQATFLASARNGSNKSSD